MSYWRTSLSDTSTSPDGDASPPLTSPYGQPRLVHTVTDRFSMANTYLICESRLVVVNPRSPLNVALLKGYIQHILHRSLNDIDLIVLTFLHPHYTSGIESLRRICSAPVAAPSSLRAQPQHVSRQQYDVSFDLWLDDNTVLPFHPDWRVLAYPAPYPDPYSGAASGNLFLYHPATQELLCGDMFTVFEGNPILRYEADMSREQLEKLLRLARSLDVSYLYPVRGRQLLRKAPFTSTRIE